MHHEGNKVLVTSSGSIPAKEKEIRGGVALVLLYLRAEAAKAPKNWAISRNVQAKSDDKLQNRSMGLHSSCKCLAPLQQGPRDRHPFIGLMTLA